MTQRQLDIHRVSGLIRGEVTRPAILSAINVLQRADDRFSCRWVEMVEADSSQRHQRFINDIERNCKRNGK